MDGADKVAGGNIDGRDAEAMEKEEEDVSDRQMLIKATSWIVLILGMIVGI